MPQAQRADARVCGATSSPRTLTRLRRSIDDLHDGALAVTDGRSLDDGAQGASDAPLLADDLPHIVFRHRELQHDGGVGFRSLHVDLVWVCLLYTSDAADEEDSV